MSDDSVDYEFEENLMAEAGYRELWVTFATGETKRVRMFPDTASWRVAADKAELEYVADPDVVRVWSTPMTERMGAGKVGVERDAAASVEADSPVPIWERGEEGAREGDPPTPAANSGGPPPLPCCEPVRHVGPSGMRRRHAWDCIHRGEPFEGPRPLDRLARSHAMQTRRAGLDDAIADHPAGGILTWDGGGCPAHPDEPALDCIACSERRAW